MVKVRQARDADRPAIEEIIRQLDLSYPAQTLGNFWVAEEKNRVVGIAALREFRDFYFLSSVGVAPGRQHKGVATKLLDKLLAGRHKDIYLFTVIPAFFLRFGFAAAAEPPEGLPLRATFGCDRCTPDLCVCLRRSAS
ncbi:MAG: GNAT family N-acetyltransferase [Candidatus Saganbacteria bacterium]|nr:GNAT family N-acetyltransferase [Candidatus Saganbacteria bacterium]